jgi:hypothetical protein
MWKEQWTDPNSKDQTSFFKESMTFWMRSRDLNWWWCFSIGSNVCAGWLNTMETTIRTKQYGGEIILPNLT